MTVHIYIIAVIVLLCLGAHEAPAQSHAPDARARASLDSTYAVQEATDRFAELIRRGDAGIAFLGDASLSSAIQEVTATARQRKRARPHASLGPLWDLRVEVGNLHPAGPRRMKAVAKAFLVTDPEGAGPVVLTFQRVGSEMVLVEQEGFAGWATAQNRRFREGRAR